MLSASSSSVVPIGWKIRTNRAKKSSPAIATGSWSSIQSGSRRGRVRAGSSDEVTGSAGHGHRTTTWWAAERNSECSSSRMTSRPAPMPRPGAQVVLEQQHLVDAVDAVDGLEQLGDGGGVEVGVERPARSPSAPPVSGLTNRSSTSIGPLADQRRGPAGRGVHQRGHGDALVVRRADLDRGADHAVLVEVLGDPGARARAASAKSSSACWPLGSVRTCGHDEQAHRAVAALRRRQAAGPGDLGRRLERQPLEVAGGDGPLAGAQRQRAADLRLVHASRRRRRRSAGPRLTTPSMYGIVVRSAVSVRAPTLPRRRRRGGSR